MAYSWQQNNQNKNNASKYSWQSGGLGKTKTELVVDEKKERVSQGLPVSLSKNRAEPGLLQTIVSAPLKPLADVGKNLLNAGEVLVGKEKTKSLYSPITGKVEGLGEIDITKSPLDPENRKVLKKSAATGAELASYLGYGGIAKKAVTATSKTSQIAAKETFAEYVKKNMPSLIKEGALTGVANTVGAQGREEDKDFDWKQAAQDIATSTVLTPLAALGLRKLFGTSNKKIMDARIADKKATKFNIPEAGVPPIEYKAKTGQLLPLPRKPGELPPGQNAIELPEPGILKAGQDLRNPPTKITSELPKTPIQERANSFNSRNDFINSERTSFNRAKDINKDVGKFNKGFKPLEVPKYTDQQLGKIWDEAHASPRQTGMPKLKNEPIYQPATQPRNLDNSSLQPKAQMEAPFVERTLQADSPTPTATAKVETPQVKTQVDEGVEVLTRNMPESVQGGNLRQYSEAVYNDLAKDIDKAKRIALGQEVPTNGVPADAYYSIIANEAEKAGDIDLLSKLSRSDSVASTSGAKLQANKLRTQGGVLDDMREIRKSRQAERGISDERFTKEQSTLLDDLKKKITDTTDISKQEIDDIVNSLICK